MPRMTPRSKSTEGMIVKNSKAPIGKKNTLIVAVSEASTANKGSSTTPRSPSSSARASAVRIAPMSGMAPTITSGTTTIANKG